MGPQGTDSVPSVDVPDSTLAAREGLHSGYSPEATAEPSLSMTDQGLLEEMVLLEPKCQVPCPGVVGKGWEGKTSGEGCFR